jgi:N4-gp56 family major capsid protein
MAISNAIPKIWASSILGNIQAATIYSQPTIVNRDYEREITQMGDTVHITSVVAPGVRAYTKNGTITWDTLSDADTSLVITQADYFAFKIDDIDKRQALPGFVAQATKETGQKLALTCDAFVATTIAAGVAAANKLGAISIDPTVPGGAYDLIVQLRTVLAKANVPPAGWWAVVPPDLYALLLRDDRFIRVDASGTDAGLRNGLVGKAAGFTIYESTQVPAAAGAFTVLAGSPIATTLANQITETEFTRLENTFADGVKGLHVYGAKVIRPTALASAIVTIETPEE